jgi:CheY-like chemotaxis protein
MRVEQPAQWSEAIDPMATRTPTDPKASEIIVLADPDAAARSLRSAALDAQGYIVLLAVNAVAALALLTIVPKVRMLIVDQGMRDADGLSLCDVAALRFPSLGAVLVTGGGFETFSARLNNPIGAQQFAGIVSATLAALE